VVVGCFDAVAAQEPARRPLSIEAALRAAEESSEQIAAARAAVQRGRGEQLRARSQYFPQLAAQVSFERALASEFEGVFGGGAPDSAGAPGDTADGGLDFGSLPFGRENTWRAGLSLSQNVFTGGRIRAQNRLAGSTRDIAEIELAATRAEVLLDVAEAYYDAALAERLLAIAQATLAQAEETLRQVRLGREVGAEAEFDLLRAQVQRDNQVPIVIQRRSDNELAQLRLKQLLDIPAETALELTSSLLEKDPGDVAGFEADTTLSAMELTQQRAPVRQARESVAVQEAALDIAQAQRLPAVSVMSQYTRVNYPQGFAPEFDELRTNWIVSVNLQVPLFTGGRLRGDEVVAAANVAGARATLQLTEELTQLDTRSVYQQLTTATAAWRASAGTVEQAERAYEIAELRFREGVSTQLEISDARILLQQAQAARARAARDLQVARMRVALLPDLPLAGSAGAGAATVPQPPALSAPDTTAARQGGSSTPQGRGGAPDIPFGSER
jgi:outer membrane protein TolC